MRRPTYLFSLAIVVAAIVSACSSGSAPSAPSPAVDGKTYLSTDVRGVAMVPGTQVRLTFKDGRLNANGGCNSMSGAYTITGDRLATKEIAMTAMGCEEPLMQQDEWLAHLIAGSTIALTGDTLTLDDGAVRLTLLDREVASPDKPIEGTRWLLNGIVSGDAVSSVPAAITASIRIVGGRVEVDAGCNMGGGTVAVTPDSLTFGPIGLTKKACEAGPATVESAVTTVLQGTVPYTIEADVLTLDAGAAGLVYRAAP